MTTKFFSLFVMNFFYISAKASQQMNVVQNRKQLAIAMSFVLATFEVAILGSVSLSFVENGYHALLLVIPIGLGASLGVILTMRIYHKK